MQRRERILALIAGGLVVLAIGQYGYGLVGAAFEERTTELDTLREQVANKEARVTRGKRAARKLSEWERRSLPPDLYMAGSLYQSWLLGLVDRAAFANASVNPDATISRTDVYQMLRFQIKGNGKLDQVTRFLHDFYSADHLHQVASIKLLPSKDAVLGVTIAVEAMVLPGAEPRRALGSSTSDRLAFGDLEQYKKVIVGRNLFAVYKPPPVVAAPGSAPKPPEFDTAKHAFVTGITQGGGRPLVWLNVRTTGQHLRLHEGQSFKVGDLEGTIARITPRAVEIETEGKRRLVPVGKSLRDGRDL
ncbi:MAG: hypothetical protein WD847_15355 [Pirellulales bacterium]